MSPNSNSFTSCSCSLAASTAAGSYRCCTTSTSRFSHTNTSSDHIATSRTNTVTSRSFANIDRCTVSLVSSKFGHIRCNFLATATIRTLMFKPKAQI